MISYKGYQIKYSKSVPSLWEVEKEGRGGSVPKTLSGAYTSTVEAKMAIDFYLNGKEKPNGE